MVLGGLLLGLGFRHAYASMNLAGKAAFDPAYITLRGMDVAQLFVGGLGVLMVTGEYGTGLIRTTMAATPQRAQVLAMKALVFAASVWVLTTVASLAGFLLGQNELTSPAPHLTLGDPAALRAVLGGGIYMTLIAVSGMAIGALLRSTALSLVALYSVILVIPVVVTLLLPGRSGSRIQEYLPAAAGEQVWHVVRTDYSLGPWQGTAVFAGFVAVAAAAAIFVIRRRDV
jgi:hypothetical protein